MCCAICTNAPRPLQPPFQNPTSAPVGEPSGQLQMHSAQRVVPPRQGIRRGSWCDVRLQSIPRRSQAAGSLPRTGATARQGWAQGGPEAAGASGGGQGAALQEPVNSVESEPSQDGGGRGLTQQTRHPVLSCPVSRGKPRSAQLSWQPLHQRGVVVSSRAGGKEGVMGHWAPLPPRIPAAPCQGREAADSEAAAARGQPHPGRRYLLG